jgi:hypothetical protein
MNAAERATLVHASLDHAGHVMVLVASRGVAPTSTLNGLIGADWQGVTQ